jgi:hypothetical protein
MQGVPAAIMARQLTHFDRADPACASALREALASRNMALAG